MAINTTMPGLESKSLIPIMSGLQTLGQFFGGKPLQEVSELNRYIAIYAGRPDWLRNLTDERLLPRRDMRYDLPHKFAAPTTEGGRANLVVWIVENGRGGWNISDRWVWFSNDVDAVLYSLRWE